MTVARTAGEPAIDVRAVSKQFRINAARPTSLKERVIGFGRRGRTEAFWALREVGFSVAPGETIAILGHNGSGKSTLLKCITGILRPTTGEIRTRGRVASLLELGAGFHPDLTGRENVYLNGSILGLSRADVDERFDEIVGFAELEDFIDQQVKHYSSGMYVRLGFAVAVTLDPDLLLVDEVLAVGDEAFQRKCMDRIHQFQQQGRTIVVVTHSADSVRQYCNRAVVLDHGRLIADDHPQAAITAYRQALLTTGRHIELDDSAGEPPEVPDELRHVAITGVEIRHPASGTTATVEAGGAVRIEVGFDVRRPVDDATVALHIRDAAGRSVYGTNTDLLGSSLGPLTESGRVSFVFDSLPLLSGTYPFSIGIHSSDVDTVYDYRDVDRLEVASRSGAVGLADLAARVE